ncbi:MAG TPA: hypothetical protein PLP01_12770 [Phycisphaerae bacterium]|nr:hypothetical protein [Phycisphaerae bacterium]
MDWNGIWQVIWNVLNSPAVIAVLAGGLLIVLNRLYAAKPTWQAFEGTIIAAVKWAEKEIPDDTPNKAFNRLNAALNYVLKVYQEARGKPADAKAQAELREGIQIVHAELEASGNLDKPAPTCGEPCRATEG